MYFFLSRREGELGSLWGGGGGVPGVSDFFLLYESKFKMKNKKEIFLARGGGARVNDDFF